MTESGGLCRHSQAAQWCTRLDSGPARWRGEHRDAPREHMGGPREVFCDARESTEENDDHGCLGAYTRAPFAVAVAKRSRKRGRANRLYDEADHRVVEFVHYYEAQCDAVAALGEELRLSG